jgi:excisionase family DNA binding protein
MSDYLDVNQAAELANVSTKTIYRAITRGDLEAFRVGRALRMREADVRAWVEAKPVKPTHAPAGWTPSPRPRKLPTTASALSAARLRAQDEEHERQRKVG